MVAPAQNIIKDTEELLKNFPSFDSSVQKIIGGVSKNLKPIEAASLVEMVNRLYAQNLNGLKWTVEQVANHFNWTIEKVNDESESHHSSESDRIVKLFREQFGIPEAMWAGKKLDVFGTSETKSKIVDMLKLFGDQHPPKDLPLDTRLEAAKDALREYSYTFRADRLEFSPERGAIIDYFKDLDKAAGEWAANYVPVGRTRWKVFILTLRDLSSDENPHPEENNW